MIRRRFKRIAIKSMHMQTSSTGWIQVRRCHCFRIPSESNDRMIVRLRYIGFCYQYLFVAYEPCHKRIISVEICELVHRWCSSSPVTILKFRLFECQSNLFVASPFLVEHVHGYALLDILECARWTHLGPIIAIALLPWTLSISTTFCLLNGQPLQWICVTAGVDLHHSV